MSETLTEKSGLLKERRLFAQSRLDELRAKLEAADEVTEIPGLCIFATGSFARGEAGGHSDIDLFFLHEGSAKTHAVSRLDELQLFAKVIDIGDDMKFPAFSNGCSSFGTEEKRYFSTG